MGASRLFKILEIPGDTRGKQPSALLGLLLALASNDFPPLWEMLGLPLSPDFLMCTILSLPLIFF